MTLSYPRILSARVIRIDGLYIHDFTFDELCKGRKYFEKWINDNLFNLEGVDDRDKQSITYWVS